MPAAARPTRSASPRSTNTSENDADEHADGRADQPPRVPLAPLTQGRPPVRHRDGGPRRLARRDAEQLQRRSSPTTAPARRSRRSGEGIANTDDPHLLGRQRQQRPHRRGRPGLHRLGDACTDRGRARSTTPATSRSPSRHRPSPQWRVTRGIRDSVEPRLAVVRRRARRSRSASSTASSSRPCRPSTSSRPATRSGSSSPAPTPATASGTGNDNVAVTLDTRTSKVTLPIQGGYAAAAAAGLTDAETVAPTLGAVPADIATATTDATGTTVTYTLPTATDNEDPNPVVTCDPASGSKFAVGTTTVTCVAKDANGNTSAPKTFNVVVRRDVPVNGTVGGTVGATLALTLGTPGAVRRVHAGHPADVPRRQHGDGHLHRGRRAAERLRPVRGRHRPPGQRHVRAARSRSRPGRATPPTPAPRTTTSAAR